MTFAEFSLSPHGLRYAPLYSMPHFSFTSTGLPTRSIKNGLGLTICSAPKGQVAPNKNCHCRRNKSLFGKCDHTTTNPRTPADDILSCKLRGATIMRKCVLALARTQCVHDFTATGFVSSYQRYVSPENGKGIKEIQVV